HTAPVRKVLLVVIVVVAVAGAILWWVRQGDVPTASDTGSTSNSGSTNGMPEITASEADEPSIPSAATEATVEFVVDGDTLFLDDDRKVRLLGIDTPEVGDNLECYGDEATALLRQLLPEGTPVWVLPDIDPLDQYGRSLLFIYRNDATNVNLELVRQGAAEVVQYDPNLLLQDELGAAEREAQSVGAGRWGSC
ncbi:MAG: thermonuclease family protein, partial [Salinibacterium sp.]|nr:thermonuclease family protein [Salinibacterium sp.]